MFCYAHCKSSFFTENLKNSSVNPQENVEEVLIEEAAVGEFDENDVNAEN